MLFPYCLESHLPSAAFDTAPESTPAQLLLSLDQALREWLGITPCLYREGNTLELFYQNMILPADECINRFGGMAAALNTAWPTKLYGAADSDELICWECTLQKDGSFLLRQHNSSGVPAQQIRELCVSIRLPDGSSAGCMSVLLQAAWTYLPYAALYWSYERFIRQQDLGEVDPIDTFCYVRLAGPATPEGKLLGLDFTQKQTLWRLFLKDGAHPPEFEWLADLMRRGQTPGHWLEWSLALHVVLHELGYQVQLGQQRFLLLDAQGNRIYYGADHLQAAERLLMKILFPLHN